MKAKILLLTLFSAFALAGCNEFNDEFETTAAGDMAGQWYCFCEEFPDYTFNFSTSNNNANEPGKLLLNDLGTFWEMIVEVDCDLNNYTFSTPGAGATNKYVDIDSDNMEIIPYDIIIKVTDGKITKNDLTFPKSKAVVNVIEFTLAFEDDSPAFAEYHFKGYRPSGFIEDDGYVPDSDFFE